MKAQHTPGPWEIEQESCDEYWVDGVHYNVGPSIAIRSLEDARLIAAAPDLLEALICIEKEMVDGHGFPLEDGEMLALDKVRAATAKATGSEA